MAPNTTVESYELEPVIYGHSHTGNSTLPSGPKRIPRHRILPWTTLLLAGISYVLTVGFLWHSDLVCKHTIFGHSQASALGTANGLSWTANTLLSASIGLSLDLVRSMLIARERGHCLLDNLPLQTGTGIDGLFEIIFKWRRLNRHHPRAWSIFRLLSMTIVPVLGIIVLSNVEATPMYFQKATQTVALGYGIGAFNASLAALLQPMADPSFGTRFKDFLSDQDLVVDISDDTDMAGCFSGLVNDPRGPCRARYFVPGGIEQFAPRLLVGNAFTTGGDLQPVIARNLNGYYLQYEVTNTTQFDQQVDCMKYGYGLASYQLCLKDLTSQKIAASLSPCPKSLAVNLQCMSNATWPTKDAWETTLKVSTRHADVIYNGLDGTILDFNFVSDTPSPVNITAPELLGVFNVLFSTSNTTSVFGEVLSAIGIASNKPIEPFIIWQYFQGLAELARNDTRANSRAQIGLQSLLSIPIYHCQAKDFAEMRHLLLEQIHNTTAIVQTLGQDLVSQFPVVEPDTEIFPAVLRYRLDVGEGSLIAYIVIAGVTLLLCLIAGCIASCTKFGRKTGDMGPFPMLTEMRDCKIVNKGGRAVLPEDFQQYRDNEILLKTANMYLHLVETRSAADRFLHADLVEAGFAVRRAHTK